MKVALLRFLVTYTKEHAILYVPPNIYCRWITRYPPLGLLYYAAILEKGGHEVMVIDAEMEDLGLLDILGYLKRFKPDALVTSINYYNPRNELEQLKYLKEHLKDVKVIARGHYPNLYPIETIRHDYVDIAITRKGFNTINELITALGESRDHVEVRGIIFKRNGEIIRTEDEPLFTDLDSLPFPARHLIQNDIYGTTLTHSYDFTTALGSVGCPYRCVYCVDRDITYKLRSPANIVAEMIQCQKLFNIKEITFLDSTFTIGRQRTLDFCNEIINRKLRMNWTIRTRCDLVDDELLRLMKRAGCVRISYGIESGDQQILDNLHRDIKKESIREAVELTSKHNILCFGFFMVGNKGETRETIEKTIGFAAELKLDFAQFAIVEPRPLTEMEKSSKAALGEDIWLEYSRGGSLSRDDFKSFDNTLSTEDLDKYIGKCYSAFYKNPRFVLKRLISLNTYRFALNLLNLIFIYIKLQYRKINRKRNV